MNSDATKVSPNHLDRDAYLYVRQSTLRQVVENTESTQRQYALRERAIALGWPIERVQVIDCDQGQSGASAADREGFQRLVAEVSLGHAGIVLGLEVSRLARNNSDWHRLLEICALTGTLDPRRGWSLRSQSIQRSFIAWFEGDDLGGGAACPASAAPRRHSEQGAARGAQDAVTRRTGLRRRRAGWSWIRIARSRTRCGPLFATYERTGSGSATVKYFREQGLLFPRRLRRGASQRGTGLGDARPFTGAASAA